MASRVSGAANPLHHDLNPLDYAFLVLVALITIYLAYKILPAVGTVAWNLFKVAFLVSVILIPVYILSHLDLHVHLPAEARHLYENSQLLKPVFDDVFHYINNIIGSFASFAHPRQN
eukprot:TRINITY_DN142_c0_g1_i1.p1 TRINITY_DN142_c0_g1~~TRINITY_DN142_c0_g1_i1.p1  ORF type:complete len:117 (-),score=13.74 TRINITY_DN142_c0_g1_i1:44-394(-)